MKAEALLNSVIVFNKRVLKTEINFSPGMKARVAGLRRDEDMLVLDLDFAEFEDHNKALAEPNFYDDAGEPCLKWHETKSYPKDCKETVYFMADEVERDAAEFEVSSGGQN
jgi:hypothetical protein